MPEPASRLAAALEGRYRIERELGAGGMATVYLAHDERHDRSVALKVLKPELAAIMGAERFLAEIRTTANLQHPHILPLFDSGEADGFLFFVMPYVAGESLRDRLDREGELPVEEAVRIAKAVAGALDYAHRQGVVHRDIKPANILLHDGEPLVADFGIALAVSAAGGGRLTETGLSLGTPYYMSPEQATAERDPDARSDVYALGSVLYEMLVGEPPYTGGSAQAVLGKILTTDPVRPTEHRRTVPAHVEAVVLRALEKRPADRFGSAAQLAGALADPRFGLGADASAARARVPAATSRLWMPTAVLALAVTVVVLSIHFTEAHPRPQQLHYTIPLPREGDAEGLYFHFRISPDGRYVAASGVIEQSSGIFVREMRSTAWRALAGTGVSDFLWSPDSRTIAFFEEGSLWEVDVDGGPVEELADARPSNQFEASGTWGAAGVIVFSADQTGPLMRVSDQGGEPVPLTTAGAGVAHRYPAFLPDGEHLLYTVRGGDSPGVYLASLDDPVGYRLLQDVSGATFAPSVGSEGQGHVIFSRQGRLMAQPFDPGPLEFTGDAFMLAERALQSDHGGIAASASENGILIYLGGRNREVDSRLVWLDREGTVLDGMGPLGSESAVTLSSDGQTAALVRQSPTERTADVWLRDLDRAREDPLTFDGRVVTFSNAVLAPEGDRIAYVWTDEATVQLRIKPAQGSGGEVVVDSAAGGALNPTDWATGGHLVYTRIDAETGADLWYLPMEEGSGAGDPVPFRQDPFQTSFGQVSPDGAWIAYVSNETGSEEVWVERFPSGSGRWRVSESGNASGTTQQPRWSASGRELFYVTGAAGRTLMVAPFAPTSPGSPVGEPRPLLGARINSYAPQLGTFFYDVSDEGQRFLASLVDRPEDPALNVLVSWEEGR